jgi:hypothetical protein
MYQRPIKANFVAGIFLKQGSSVLVELYASLSLTPNYIEQNMVYIAMDSGSYSIQRC